MIGYSVVVLTFELMHSVSTTSWVKRVGLFTTNT